MKGKHGSKAISGGSKQNGRVTESQQMVRSAAPGLCSSTRSFSRCHLSQAVAQTCRYARVYAGRANSGEKKNSQEVLKSEVARHLRGAVSWHPVPAAALPVSEDTRADSSSSSVSVNLLGRRCCTFMPGEVPSFCLSSFYVRGVNEALRRLS